MSNPPNSSTVGLVSTSAAIGFGKCMELFVSAEPFLASLSYLVAIIVGIVTLYYKFKKKE